MKIKIFIVSLSIMIAIILTTTIVLSAVKTGTPFNNEDPSIINIYKSSTEASNTYKKGSEKYEKLLETYKKIFSKSLISQIKSGKYIDKTLSVNNDGDVWDESYKTTGVCVEFIFENVQTLKIYENGNSRIIKIRAFIFKLDEENENKKVNFYYRTNDVYEIKDEYNDFIKPLSYSANTSILYNYLMK